MQEQIEAIKKRGFISVLCVSVYGIPEPWLGWWEDKGRARLNLAGGDGRVIIEASPESYMEEPLTQRETDTERERVTVVE